MNEHTPKLPSYFEHCTIPANDAELFVQFGGAGPAVVLLHGHAQNGNAWAPLAADLARDHRVVVPDLRGLGRSSRAAAGYEKAAQAGDVRAIVEALGIDDVAVVGHDLGGMVAYAYAARYPSSVHRLVIMDAPLPGIGPWEALRKMPALWHWNFGGSVAERLVAGREHIYLEHFWDYAADPSKIRREVRAYYAEQYAAPGAMRAAFTQFAAFPQDARDNAVLARNALTMKVLAMGAQPEIDGRVTGLGPWVAATLREVASDVEEVVVAGSGHWLLEEEPGVVVARIREFLEGAPRDRKIFQVPSRARPYDGGRPRRSE
ncbi:alpha/beta fold hydrolase [Pendulispora rubella]